MRLRKRKVCMKMMVYKDISDTGWGVGDLKAVPKYQFKNHTFRKNEFFKKAWPQDPQC